MTDIMVYNSTNKLFLSSKWYMPWFTVSRTLRSFREDDEK